MLYLEIANIILNLHMKAINESHVGFLISIKCDLIYDEKNDTALKIIYTS